MSRPPRPHFELAAALDVLHEAGLEPTVINGSKHTKLEWFNHDGRRRVYIVSRRPQGNWRQVKNIRSTLRNMIKSA